MCTLRCPSFPWRSCFLGVFIAAQFLALFEVFSACLPVFLGSRKVRKVRGERTWAIANRPFHANQSSELNFPSFLGKNGSNSEERGVSTNPSFFRYGPSSSSSKKVLGVLGGLPWCFQKDQGKEGQGSVLIDNVQTHFAGMWWFEKNAQ